MENIGYITAGKRQWNFRQLINGQGNQEQQELQLILGVNGTNLNIGFDFQHKVTHMFLTYVLLHLTH
jgi:hypothetical protein